MYRMNQETGDLRIMQEMQLSSARNNTGAEILIHSNGKWVYVSSRGVGLVIFFQLEEGDRLRKVSIMHSMFLRYSARYKSSILLEPGLDTWHFTL